MTCVQSRFRLKDLKTQEDLRMLLVEDHHFQLLAMQSLLKSYGFHQLTTAQNAQEALHAMANACEPFDILLCDQCLPDIPGLELIAMASHLGLIRQAILLSGLSVQELDALAGKAHERRLPLLGYLTKPLNAPEFRRLLARRPSSTLR